MNHPLLHVQHDRRLPIFLLFLALTVLTMLALNTSGRALVTGAAPAGIISYEFAGDVSTANKIIASWDEIARIYAGFNLGLDYAYLLLYSTAIAMTIVWLSEGLSNRGWFLILAVALAWGQWLAAGLDAIENFALLRLLVTIPVEPWPQIAWWCAAIKFSLVIAGLLCVVLTLALRLVERTRSQN